MRAALNPPPLAGGDLSGASQPHKHVQLLPLEDDADGPPIERLACATHVEREGTCPLPSLPPAHPALNVLPPSPLH